MLTSRIYSLLISEVTDLCYSNCFLHLLEHSTILDVGIGTGQMIRRWHELIRQKDLHITGLDTNAAYLKNCTKLIAEFALADHIRVLRMPVQEFVPVAAGTFDAVLFSMSFMLIQDRRSVLNRVARWLKPSGEIIFVHTLHMDQSRIMRFVKPRLKYVTSIDFGQVMYEDEFFDLLRSADLNIVSDRVLMTTWFGDQYRMIVTKCAVDCEHADD